LTIARLFRNRRDVVLKQASRLQLRRIGARGELFARCDWRFRSALRSMARIA